MTFKQLRYALTARSEGKAKSAGVQTAAKMVPGALGKTARFAAGGLGRYMSATYYGGPVLTALRRMKGPQSINPTGYEMLSQAAMGFARRRRRF